MERPVLQKDPCAGPAQTGDFKDETVLAENLGPMRNLEEACASCVP